MTKYRVYKLKNGNCGIIELSTGYMVFLETNDSEQYTSDKAIDKARQDCLEEGSETFRMMPSEYFINALVNELMELHANNMAEEALLGGQIV